MHATGNRKMSDQNTNSENPAKGVNAVGKTASVYEQQLATGALGQAEPTRGYKDAADWVEINVIGSQTVTKRS
jgi:hypothetical protein